jgi:hypothetical protein
MFLATPWLQLIVFFVGLLMFLLADVPSGAPPANHPNVKRIGEILMFVGGLSFLLLYK